MTCECNNSSEIPCTMLLLYRYFFHRISAKFYVDLSATISNFQYSSRSSYLVNLMTPQNLLALCCNFTRMFFTWNSWNSSIFLNFQTSPRSGCMLHMITPWELDVSSYNFTRRVSTYKSLSGWGVLASLMPIFLDVRVSVNLKICKFGLNM